MAQEQETAAAIDIGSNTVHLLVASWHDDRIEPRDDESELVGLAEDVYAGGAAGGAISPTRLREAVDAVARLAERAREHGARSIQVVATAAVRDAANAAELAGAVRARTGLQMELIDGAREAALTYRGAAAGEDAASLQVCDVGGGSTEVIRATERQITLATSLPIGSSRLARLYSADPPSTDELARVRVEAARILAALPPWAPALLVVTGGTATALARVAGSAARRYTMTVEDLAHAQAALARQPAAAIAGRYGITAKRARLLPAGAAIIAALREGAGTASVVLTAGGLRDGLLIEHFEGKG